jgi:glycosyltransferase involved in cell wall biosynthesis
MKLAIVTPFLETAGGVERVVLKIAQHFDASIHTIRYDKEGTFPEFQGLDIHLHTSRLGKVPLGKRVASAVEAGKVFYSLKLRDYDLVNAHQTPSEWARNRNSPMIWHCHSPNREAFDLYEWRMKQRNPAQRAIFWSSIQAFKFFESQTVPKIEHIFANSRNTQARIRKYLNRDSEVLYPGIDAERFGCAGYEKFFLYPSRIVPEKRIEFAIDAFERFRKANPNKGEWKLIIAGSVSERPEHKGYLAGLRSMAAGVPGVQFRMNVTEQELLSLYSRCYSVLYTPINEDFGLIPLEGFASSKPCIAVNEGGPRETVDDGVDGFLIDSPDAMAQKMSYLAQRPELARSMGKIARKKAETKFNWDRFLTRFGQKAEELIKEENK